MPKITPFLWYDSHAEEAANHYISIFKHSNITNIARYGDAGPGPKGSVMTVAFQLEGQGFIALNGGPMFKLNEAISLSVDCKTQREVDELWGKAFRWRPTGSMRLAQRQVRPLLADRAIGPRRDAPGQRS